MVGWAAIATFLIETVTLLWIPAKEAAVPNLIPRARLETANQLTLITTYGLTPVAAALGLAALDRGVRGARRRRPARPGPSRPSSRSTSTPSPGWPPRWWCSFGIKEISRHRPASGERTEQSMLRQFVDGWQFIGKTPLVRGLVLGIFGAFAGGGIVDRHGQVLRRLARRR